MAINSELVGFPLELLTVKPKYFCRVSRSPRSQALLGLERVGEDGTEFLAGVSNENGFLRFHACMSPPVGKRLCQLPQIFQMM